MNHAYLRRFPALVLASVLALAILAGAVLSAAAAEDRAAKVRRDREAYADDSRWIYNDLERGFAEAARNGKPLFVVLRCVP